MSDRQIERIVGQPEQVPGMMAFIETTLRKALRGGPVRIVLGRPKRSNGQNAKLWAMLTDVSAQVDWYGHKLSKEDWKHVFSASLFGQRAVPGLDGGFVVLGQSTSDKEVKPFSELVELIYAFGAERQVRWSEPALALYDELHGGKR